MNDHQKDSSKTWAMALSALGVVYGDIGTSPLYTLKVCLSEGRFVQGDMVTVLGPVSLMLWSLTIIVTLKYLLLLCRATNQGEGGVFALLSILRNPKAHYSERTLRVLGIFAILGAALLYGDGIITPAISVLSAVEGLKDPYPHLEEWVVPISVCILFGLFVVQRFGTHRIGVSFGPVMMLWFAVLGGTGLVQLVQHPQALAALSPHQGILFFIKYPSHSVGLMGAVLLCATGCEALYADIGHFGATAMKRSWFFIAYPALALNYLGQTGLILSDPASVTEKDFNPFFKMVPHTWNLPLVILSTFATIIASQAMITGVFSLTQQAMQLGFLPRLKIVYTNPENRGQIYMPQINFLLGVACLLLVIKFQKSEHLADAYGLSVSANMLLTSLLFLGVSTRVWGWPAWKAVGPVALFLLIECAYVAGGVSKFFHGAWMPVVVTILLWILMKTWQDGRAILWELVKKGQLPEEFLLQELDNKRIPRVRGTGVFMSSSAVGLPLVLLHHLKHNKALHECVVLLSVQFEDVPHMGAAKRVQITHLQPDFHRIVLHYGFMESPEVMKDLCRAMDFKGLKQMDNISFYQSRELLLTTGKGKMSQWRKKLFVFLSRLARPATGYFQLPPRQVIELGIQMEM
jgi:KUP system potassium uptake protein